MYDDLHTIAEHVTIHQWYKLRQHDDDWATALDTAREVGRRIHNGGLGFPTLQATVNELVAVLRSEKESLASEISAVALENVILDPETGFSIPAKECTYDEVLYEDDVVYALARFVNQPHHRDYATNLSLEKPEVVNPTRVKKWIALAHRLDAYAANLLRLEGLSRAMQEEWGTRSSLESARSKSKPRSKIFEKIQPDAVNVAKKMNEQNHPAFDYPIVKARVVAAVIQALKDDGMEADPNPRTIQNYLEDEGILPPPKKD